MRASALLLLPMLALPLAAQTPAAPAAPVVIPPAAEQIAKAVLPLPTEFRADASVLGFNAAGELVSLRKGTGGMLCLADDPKDADYHGACYQKALEPFMARGRELRAWSFRRMSVICSMRWMGMVGMRFVIRFGVSAVAGIW